MTRLLLRWSAIQPVGLGKKNAFSANRPSIVIATAHTQVVLSHTTGVKLWSGPSTHSGPTANLDGPYPPRGMQEVRNSAICSSVVL